MFKIDSSTAATVMPTPEAPGPTENGFFTDGTTITADWLNAVQEEICYVITQAGLTLSKSNRGQLYTAIQSIFADSGTGNPLHFFGTTEDAYTAGDTLYFSNHFTTDTAPGSTNATKYLCYLMDGSYSLTNLNVSCAVAPGGSDSYTFTVYKNGVATAIVAAITGSEMSGEDSAHAVSVVTGDAICVRVDISATATVNPFGLSWSLTSA
jgi:hypothetical protein